MSSEEVLRRPLTQISCSLYMERTINSCSANRQQSGSIHEAHLEEDGALCNLVRYCVRGQAQIPERGVEMAPKWLPPPALCCLALPGKFYEGVYLGQAKVQVPVQEVGQVLPSTCAAAIARLLCRSLHLKLTKIARQH